VELPPWEDGNSLLDILCRLLVVLVDLSGSYFGLGATGSYRCPKERPSFLVDESNIGSQRGVGSRYIPRA
jgi:hypothetical protein